jgi:hypothetical protein
VFSPYLTFSVLEGLDAPEFNTVRPHSAWGKRVAVGDTLTLYDTVNERVLSQRQVTRVYHGDKQRMLREHAAYNHALLNGEHSDPAQALKKILIRSMGKNFYNNADTASVIYLA